ncbi:DNA repair protein RadC [Bacillus cereus VD196]|uniref:DNA repair protein RadC n=1 Tax=Bacillus cereus VD196 TaxID=1053243 RepID=A0A9W5V750_BACCE|nr:DNA repair protein RadC [Bacillus cereus VD196]
MFTWSAQVNGIRVLVALLIHAVLFCFVIFRIYENFTCLYLNTKNQVIHRQTIFIGSLNTSIVHPREVFKEAFRRAAASIICLHNHPSGDPTPSREDIAVTKRLVECGQIIGIEVLDHIIIGDHKFVSLKEKGHI